MKVLFKLILLIIALFLLRFGFAQVKGTEKKLVRYVDQNNAQYEALLEEIVNINSGTMNFEGVRQVAEVLKPKFEALGMEVQITDGSSFNRAGHLIATIKGGKGKKLLLIGHLDTVFEKDSPFQEYERIGGDIVKGPGVADMKGGDVVILQALAALHSEGLLQEMNVMVVMTGDEELSGEPLSESKKALIEGAKWADIALGFENGDGNPATANVARRSSSGWTLKVNGNAAHSSQVFQDRVGAGAIYEASRILYQFYTELKDMKNLTYNPGVFLGGTTVTHDVEMDQGTAFGKSNVVSKDVTVTGDIRSVSKDQLSEAMKKMQAIVADNLPGTSATITFSEGYPPFSPTDGNYELLKQFSQVSQDLGFGNVDAVDPRNAGAADISFTSDYIEMGLDGLGMAGADDHTVNETGDLKALPIQSKRAAVLMYRLTR